MTAYYWVCDGVICWLNEISCSPYSLCHMWDYVTLLCCTLINCCRGKPLAWDVTVYTTVADCDVSPAKGSEVQA